MSNRAANTHTQLQTCALNWKTTEQLCVLATAHKSQYCETR